MPRIKIELKRYNERGWEWRAALLKDGKEIDVWHARTNGQGEGLWYLMKIGRAFHDRPDTREVEWKQVTGTCQFSLPCDRKKAYDRIRYVFSKSHPPEEDWMFEISGNRDGIFV